MRVQMILLLVLAVLVSGCGEVEMQKQVVDPITSIGQSQDSWMDTELVNIQNSTSFTVSEYDEAVLVETFAVWCPTCLRQQQELEQLDVAHIAVNTDPNEDEALVREYVEEHGFSAPYVIASDEFIDELIDRFGIGIVNAPSSPIVLVCPDGQAELLARGFKSASELREAVSSCS